jgi:hypothetical protein
MRTKSLIHSTLLLGTQCSRQIPPPPPPRSFSSTYAIRASRNTSRPADIRGSIHSDSTWAILLLAHCAEDFHIRVLLYRRPVCCVRGRRVVHKPVSTAAREQAVLLGSGGGWVAPQEVQDKRQRCLGANSAQRSCLCLPPCPHAQAEDLKGDTLCIIDILRRGLQVSRLASTRTCPGCVS